MVKGTTGSLGKKSDLDKFYTDPKIAKNLINILKKEYKDAVYIEPSAGNGSFSKQIDCIALDIEPEDKSIRKQDWLKYKWEDVSDEDFVVVFGNPPFGTSSDLAIKFIKKTEERADVIAFILPQSFMKDSYINKIPKNYHLKEDVCGTRGICMDCNFILNNKPYKVPTVFQIWEKQDFNRKKRKKKTKSEIIEFTDKESADFRIQRVGGNAGKAFLDKDKVVESNYFIYNKIKNKISNEKLIDIINNLEYETISYTSGPKSLSKEELIESLESEFKIGDYYGKKKR